MSNNKTTTSRFTKDQIALIKADAYKEFAARLKKVMQQQIEHCASQLGKVQHDPHRSDLLKECDKQMIKMRIYDDVIDDIYILEDELTDIADKDDIIIKAAESCQTEGGCDDCPYAVKADCVDSLKKDAADLVARLKNENESLKYEYDLVCSRARLTLADLHEMGG